MKTTAAVLLGVLIAHGASGQELIFNKDPNAPSTALRGDETMASRYADAVRASEIAEGVFAESVKAHTNRSERYLCTIVVLQGPADRTSIRFGVFNTAAEQLTVLILDSFRAFEKRSLLHESVFDAVGPAGGSLRALYPTAAPGENGVVLGFENFTPFNSAAFSTDPDSYDDPDFGATVGDLDKTVIEAVYSNGLRCRGTLQFDSRVNASIAKLLRVSPRVP